jgi:hypothetical protein
MLLDTLTDTVIDSACMAICTVRITVYIVPYHHAKDCIAVILSTISTELISPSCLSFM